MVVVWRSISGLVVSLILAPALAHPASAAEVDPAAAAPVLTAESAQAAYEESVRQAIGKSGMYPTSREARIERPTGSVKGWVEVSRNGAVKGLGISKSSNSVILDQAALVHVLARVKYPPFPAAAWSQESFHLFTFTIVYDVEPVPVPAPAGNTLK